MGQRTSVLIATAGGHVEKKTEIERRRESER